MNVYLIHFQEKLAHAGHYLGKAENIAERLARHKAGRGAKLLQVLKQKNINFEVVRIWENVSPNFERKLKTAGHNNKLCPICFPDTWHKRGLK